MKNYNPSPFEEISAAISIAGLLVLSPLFRPWYSRWGATDTEVKSKLPGDEIVAHSNMDVTRAITIKAPAPVVWAWLVQIGHERGGLYTYQSLENLIGCKIKNADRIVPAWQAIEIGQNIRLGPKGYPLFRIVAFEPGCSLVMQACDPVKEEPGPASWVFVLQEMDANTCRLITRSRNGAEWTLGNRIMWRGITDPMHFVMERRMLIGIRDRAEG